MINWWTFAKYAVNYQLAISNWRHWISTFWGWIYRTNHEITTRKFPKTKPDRILISRNRAPFPRLLTTTNSNSSHQRLPRRIFILASKGNQLSSNLQPRTIRQIHDFTFRLFRHIFFIIWKLWKIHWKRFSSPIQLLFNFKVPFNQALGHDSKENLDKNLRKFLLCWNFE